MLVLPLIDLLTMAGTFSLVIAFVLKAIDLTTRFHGNILGFDTLDFVLLTGICWGFALVLAARSWVRLNEPNLMALRREQMTAEAKRRARAYDLEHELGGGDLAGGEPAAEPGPGAAGEPRREAAGGKRS